MGAECCSATSNQKNQQILAQKTQQQIDQQVNVQQQKQFEQKQIEENNIKTKFYGSAGVSCSKTMTAQKNGDLQNLIKNANQEKLNCQQLDKIHQDEEQNQNSKNQSTKKQQNLRKRRSSSTVIAQQANLYLHNMFQKITH